MVNDQNDIWHCDWLMSGVWYGVFLVRFRIKRRVGWYNRAREMMSNFRLVRVRRTEECVRTKWKADSKISSKKHGDQGFCCTECMTQWDICLADVEHYKQGGECCSYASSVILSSHNRTLVDALKINVGHDQNLISLLGLEMGWLSRHCRYRCLSDKFHARLYQLCSGRV